MEQKNWRLYGYVIASNDRKKIVQCLMNHPKIPSQLAKENKLRITRISTALTDLAKRGLVECLNPNSRKGKVYRLTEKGKKIAKMLLKEGES